MVLVTFLSFVACGEGVTQFWSERQMCKQQQNETLRPRSGPHFVFKGLVKRLRDHPSLVITSWFHGARIKSSVEILSVVLCCLCSGQPAIAQENAGDTGTASTLKPDTNVPEAWSAHGQFTLVAQSHKRFKSPYAGANSLYEGSSTKETADLTAFLGARLWTGGELYLNPEIDQGFGLSNTVGVAGFPSGEAYKVGRSQPYFRLNRAFFRQVVDLGGERERVDAGANALAGSKTKNNITITVGKFSVVDVFDNNAYAHDPRADFLNWSVIDAGAFDYAADAWGYTYGVAAEWTQNAWTLRTGVFALSKVPNSEVLDSSFRQYSLITELEARHELFGHPGKVKLLAFINHGRMARYDDAVGSGHGNGVVPDPAPVRRFASRPGVALNLEQEIAAATGVFARASINDGTKEAFEFTEINRSLSAGGSIKGGLWRRTEDTVGIAVAVNAISSAAQRYFAAGGIGILIGDGQLPHYGPERIVETWYSAKVTDAVSLGFNFQRIVHPAYNRDRGPVSIFAARLHADF